MCQFQLWYLHQYWLKKYFDDVDLIAGFPTDLITQRAFIGKTSENSKFLKLFYRIRDSLSHGKFIVIEVAGEDVIVMQDDNTYNVTARIVIKKETLIGWIQIIDQNRMLAY